MNEKKTAKTEEKSKEYVHFQTSNSLSNLPHNDIEIQVTSIEEHLI